MIAASTGGRFVLADDAKGKLRTTLASSATTNLPPTRAAIEFITRKYLQPALITCTLVHTLGSHLIFSTYGFWLPNDPRGSGSTRVRTQHIYDAGGEATKVNTIHSVAARSHDRRLRLEAKQALKFPPVELSGAQARAVGAGIAAICPKIELVIHACAIMPDHVHLVVATHTFAGDEIIACLKRAGTRAMNEAGLHPLAAHSRSSGKHPCPWGENGWTVKLESSNEMHDRIQYVEENPIKAGLKPQRWSFVVPYEGKRGT